MNNGTAVATSALPARSTGPGVPDHLLLVGGDTLCVEEMPTDVTASLPLLPGGSSSTHFAHRAAVAKPGLLLEVRARKIFLLEAERVVRFAAGNAVQHLPTPGSSTDEAEILFRSFLAADHPNPIHSYLLLVEWLKEINRYVAFTLRNLVNVDWDGFQGFLWRSATFSLFFAKLVHLNAGEVLGGHSSRLKAHGDEVLKTELEVTTS